MSSHPPRGEDPNPNRFQKAVTGKRFFTFDAIDYFREDMNAQQYQAEKKKDRDKAVKQALESNMEIDRVQDRAYLYLSIYYDGTRTSNSPLNPL